MSIPDNDKKTKEQILRSCLELVDKEGFEGITVRKIASKAGVNGALINYYFGSKEKLIDEAVRLLISGFRESFRVLEDADLTAREKLKAFMTGYADVINTYHDVVLRFLTKNRALTDSQHEYVAFLKAGGFDTIKSLLRELTGEEDDKRLYMMMLQIGSAVIGPIMLYPLISSVFSDIPKFNESTLGVYIDSFLDLFLNKYKNQPKEDSIYAARKRNNRFRDQSDL